MTTAQVVETSVTVTNSSFQNYTHLDDHTRPKNLGCRCGKQAKQGFWNKIPNQTGPPDPDRPWRLLPPSSLQRPHVWADPCAGLTSGQGLRSDETEIQGDKHPARVWNDQKQDSGGRSAQHLFHWQGILVRSCDAVGHLLSRHWHKDDPQNQPPEKVHERHPSPLCWALCHRRQGFRNVLKPWPDESQHHGERLTQRALQQQHQRQGHLGRGQPLLCQDKK